MNIVGGANAIFTRMMRGYILIGPRRLHLRYRICRDGTFFSACVSAIDLLSLSPSLSHVVEHNE